MEVELLVADLFQVVHEYCVHWPESCIVLSPPELSPVNKDGFIKMITGRRKG